MNTKSCTVNIGKNGVTPGFFEILRNAFNTREDVRVCVLKSGGHEKARVKELAEKIIAELGDKFTYRIVGFTIFLKKWRKARILKR